VSQPPPSPSEPFASQADVFNGYLDYFRARIVDGVESLPESELNESHLASRWTPLQLLKHLRYVELRWLEWGFDGRAVENPWGDHEDHHWFVEETETRRVLIEELESQATRSRFIIESNDLKSVGKPGPRWEGQDPPTLERILFHVLQEYARHLGHLDIVCELVSGAPER
jgi:uncharacterized damage-inducible protein DinB